MGGVFHAWECSWNDPEEISESGEGSVTGHLDVVMEPAYEEEVDEIRSFEQKRPVVG